MKTLLRFIAVSVVAAAALLAPQRASAQYGGTYAQTVIAGGTNKAVALSTNAYFTLDSSRSEYLSMFCDFKFLNAPGAGDATGIRVDFYRGIAGAWESNSFASWTLPGNSTTAASQMTNITVGAVPLIRARIANISTNSHATNITFIYGIKR